MRIPYWLFTKKVFVAGVSAFVSFAVFFGLLHKPKLFWLWLPLWLFVLAALYWFGKQIRSWRIEFLPVALCTALAATGFVSVVEHPLVLQFSIILTSVAMGALYGWGLETDEENMIGIKPYRRFVVMLVVFDVYALITFLFALSAFFAQPIFFFLFVLIGAMIYGGGAYLMWRLYIVSRMSIAIWALLLGFMAAELLWVVHLLPFSYGILGLITTWIWYVAQLFIRFHITKKGIIWRKQVIFLSGNAVLLTLILFFFVRWV